MHRLLLTAVLLAAGCGSDIRSEGKPSATDRFPRLTHAQWEETVKDLFRLPVETGLSAMFTPDPQLGRFDNNIARLQVSSGLWRGYQQAAELLATRAVAEPEIYAVIVPDAVAGNARQFIESFGLRAFRRPLKPDEVERYLVMFESAPEVFPQDEPFKAGVRMIVQTMLQSPFFLYRTELSTAKDVLGIPLTGYEVASRLSYLLWNTMPDDELFAAAAAGELATAEGVRAQALRLLESDRARAQFRRFHFQAFSISEYGDLDKNTTMFPNWRPEIGAMMQEEAVRFLDAVFANDGGITDLLTSTKAYVNADLAKIYGLEGSFGEEFQEVELDPTVRAGLLTRAGFLARNATLTEPDPIHRGVFINIGILCRQITAPPNIPDDLMPQGNTNRERINSITGEGTCGEGCHHQVINPLGFAFENYDAIGAYRTTDNGFPVDAADSYTFANGREIKFQNAVDLSKQLAEAPEVHACYSQQLLEFVLGRDLQQADRVVVREMATQSLRERLSIKELVLSLVTSNTFRMRSIETRSTP